MVIAGPMAPVATGQPAPPSSLISVSFTPKAAPPGCAPFPADVVHSAGSSQTEFRITITVNRRLCTPVGATAAVYDMPSATVAWPQTLSERKVLTLQESGTYVVAFQKACRPLQFDLIAGTANSVTPPQISPSGPWHGPLLFPFDTGTALQWNGCTTTTSTTSSTTTTTTTSSTTTSSSTTSTTVPASTTTVPGPTTTVPGPTTTVPVDVAGETTVAPPPPAQVAGIASTNGSLAFTGLGPTGYLLGGGLVAIGLVLMMFGRRPISQR